MDIRVSEILQKNIVANEPVKNLAKSEAFSFTLSKLSEDGLGDRLEVLINEISDQGQRINRHMDIADVRHYRSLIANFVNEVVTHSHEFNRENFLDKRGRHRVYGIVKVINKELDELAEEVLKTEKNALTILEKTGQIQGLILDIIA